MKNKNIWLLPTDKPSRLLIYNSKLTIANFPVITPTPTQQNIYITDDSKIKEGNWCIDEKENIIKADKDFVFNCSHEFDEFWKKIILSTDQDLIKDGVQAIDDEFLEWFVKNPICEEVEVDNYVHSTETGHIILYNIVIPEEELSTKLHIGEVVDESYPKEFEQGIDINAFKQKANEIIESVGKQETLEEAALKEAQLSYFGDEVDAYVRGSVFGAKWQAETMYSEEEVDTMLTEILKERYQSVSGIAIVDVKHIQKVFNQFKKK